MFRKNVASALIAGFAVLGCTQTSHANTSEPTDDGATARIVLIGDSMSVSTDPTAWSSVVAAEQGLDIRRYASAGSGILMGGENCTTGSFMTRLDAIGEDLPEMVIVEDAVGSVARCVDGQRVATPRTRVKEMTDDFLRELAIRAQRIGLARERVVIMMPSTAKIKDCDWMRDLARTAAARHRFTYIQPYLTVNQTVDGIHPNAAGQLVLSREVAENS